MTLTIVPVGAREFAGGLWLTECSSIKSIEIWGRTYPSLVPQSGYTYWNQLYLRMLFLLFIQTRMVCFPRLRTKDSPSHASELDSRRPFFSINLDIDIHQWLWDIWAFHELGLNCYLSRWNLYGTIVLLQKLGRPQVDYHTWKRQSEDATNTLENELSPLPSLMSTWLMWLYIIRHATIIESPAYQFSVCVIPLWLIGIILPPGPSLSDHASSCCRT